ncbi:MAG: hypothetical protein RLZZ21_252 [Planctomycetota bacterium]
MARKRRVDLVRPQSRFEDDIRNWESDESHSADSIHKHFECVACDATDWCDVAEEGRRLWMISFGERLDDYSPELDVIYGVSAAAWDAALSHVSRVLGVSKYAIESLIEMGGAPVACKELTDLCSRIDREKVVHDIKIAQIKMEATDGR